MPLIRNSTTAYINNLKEDIVDALLMVPHVTIKRFDYASGLPPARFVALYRSQPTMITFDSLTEITGWRTYVLFLSCIVFFGVLYRVTENVLLPPERVSFVSA